MSLKYLHLYLAGIVGVFAAFEIGIDGVEAAARMVMSVGMLKRFDTTSLIDCSSVSLLECGENDMCVSVLSARSAR